MRVTLMALVFVVGTSTATWAGSARLQICGDVDGNDAVTVTDGVAVLRAAAELSSACTPEVCDIDVNGTITVTDGITVLRKAAGLPIRSNCVAKRVFVDEGVAQLVRKLQPFLVGPFKFVPQIAAPRSPGEIPCDNLIDEGLVDISVDGRETTISFSDCRLGSTLFNGDLIDGAVGLEVSGLEIADFNDDTLGFDGTLLALDSGTSLRLSGRLDVTYGLSFPEISDFPIVLGDLEVSPTGAILGGFVRLDLRDAELSNVLAVEEDFDGSNLATVVTTFSSGPTLTQKALFDTTTGNFL